MPSFAALSARPWRAFAVVMLCLAAGLVQAQSTTAADDSADPPGRVARLSYTAGDLDLLAAGATDWSDASVNRPLTSGDKLATGEDSRAELELGGGTLRLDGVSDLGVLDLDDQLAQIELTRGTLGISVRDVQPGESYEIDTPAVALVIDQPGRFRVDVRADDGSTVVTAFDGGATVFGENGAQRTINPGRSYRFVDASLAMVTISEIAGGDAFDAWSAGRDRRYAASQSRQYVDDDVVGYQDLDDYGAWQDTSEYGAVWFPRQVGADWAPYRNGHWAYIAPWGWTWVDEAPWGFAPYHYGRWAYVRGGWGWVPGPRGARAVYAPALVAFVGGGGWSIGLGAEPVGWFPLGPGEIYNPWYRCGRDYYTRVNIHNIRWRRDHDRRHDVDDMHHHFERFRAGRPDPHDRYANRHARGFTAMPGRSFADGARVQRARLKVDPRKLATAPVAARGAKLLPRRNVKPRGDQARAMPAAFHRDVVARHAPAVRRGVRPTTSNVRVLQPRQATGTHAHLPVVPRIAPLREPGRLSNVAASRPTPQRVDREALPSARFAHPTRAAGPAHEAMRPGVSFISRDHAERAPPRARESLPAVPVIHRPANTSMPRERAAIRQPAVSMRHEAPPVRAQPTPRVQPVERMSREPVRAQPAPRMRPVERVSREPVRPMSRPVQIRSAPLQRAASHEEHNASRAAPRAEAHDRRENRH